MKAENASRAARLVAARDGVRRLVRAMKRTKPNSWNGNWRGMKIAIGDFTESSSKLDASIKIDLETARKLIPLIQDVIGDELAAIGVSP